MDGEWPLDRLPPAAVARVRGSVGAILAEVVGAISAGGSPYAEVLAGPEGLAIRMGIEQAIHAFLDAIEHGERPGAEAAELWRRLGEAEFQSGRGLEEMRSAFRTGTRAAWRAAAELAAGAGISTQQVIHLAEAIFVFGDELAGGVVEGYVRIQSDQAGELERRRRRLAALLLDGAGHDGEAIVRAAELARWVVPRSVAVLAIAGEDAGAVVRRLGVDALRASDPQGTLVILPDPDGPGRAETIARAATGLLAVLGPAVPVGQAERSARWARLVLGLIERGALPAPHRAGGPARAGEHLATAIVLQDKELAHELSRSRLGPLERLRAHERERLIETLGAWLAHQRHVPAVADELHVHPQTVRYRVARLRELLGARLDSPEGRFELELALRARRGLRAQPPLTQPRLTPSPRSAAS